MFPRTSDLHYPSPADLNRWGRSVDRAAASHSSLLLGLYFGAASPPSSGAEPAALPDELRFQLLPQPHLAAPSTPAPESVLGRLSRGGSFLPKLASPLSPPFDSPDPSADAEAGDSDLTDGADDYMSADPLADLLPVKGDNALPAAGDDFSPQDAWPGVATVPAASNEPAWPDALLNAGGPQAAAGGSQPGAAADSGTSPTDAAFVEPARGGLYGAGALPQPPKLTVIQSDSVKLKQETVRAISVDFSERNQQQFNEIKRSMSYYEASIRALFR